MHRFADDVPDAVKRRRNNELLSIQGQVSAQVHSQMVGKTVRVFVEAISHRATRATRQAGIGATVTLGWEQPVTQMTGRTDGDLIVVFDGHPSQVGSILEVRIERSAPLILFGRLVHQPAQSVC